MRSLALAAILLVLGAFAARESDARRATPRATPGAASLLGGFTALAVQVLWQRADAAVMEHREDDAQIAYAAIEELEPQLVSGGDFVARSLADLASGHEAPAVRWSYFREGRRVLDRTVDANPGDAVAYAARGAFCFQHMSDPAVRAFYEKEFEKDGPFERARLDLARATQMRPEWRVPWVDLAVSSSYRAVEVFEAGDYAKAASLWRDARRAYRKVVGFLASDADPTNAANRDAKADDAKLADELAAVCEAAPETRAARLADLRSKYPDAVIPATPRR